MSRGGPWDGLGGPPGVLVSCRFFARNVPRRPARAKIPSGTGSLSQPYLWSSLPASPAMAREKSEAAISSLSDECLGPKTIEHRLRPFNHVRCSPRSLRMGESPDVTPHVRPDVDDDWL